ncbi:hypothetical protein SGRIM128S_05205 [Streptomyces griseomycini]
MPSRRTVRTTPPPPGSRPRVTSGQPILEPGASRAMRWWQARATSRWAAAWAAQAEQAQELGVEPRLQRAHRHVPAVGRLVRAVVRTAAVEEVGAAPVLPGAGGEHAVDHRGEVGGAVHDGGVDDLPGAAGARVVQGGEDADDEVEGAARVVAEEVGRDGRGPVRVPDHAEGAGEGEVRDVVPRAVGERALLAPAGHPAVDQARVAGVAVPGTDAEALGDAGAVALDQDVGAFGQVEDACGAVGRLQVDDHGALVAVGDVVRRVDAESRAAGAVHADDVGAQVGEEHGGERAGPDTGQLDHAHAGERAVPRCLRFRHPQLPVPSVTQPMSHQ